MMNDFLYLSLGSQVPDSLTGNGPVDLQSLDKDRLRDELEGGDFFDDTLVSGFIKGDEVLSLVLDFSFRPFLLLG